MSSNFAEMTSLSPVRNKGSTNFCVHSLHVPSQDYYARKRAPANFSSQSLPKKRARVGLSLSEKKALCLHRRMFPKKRHHELASLVFDNFGNVIAKNTGGDIVRREEFWLATSDDAATLHKVESKVGATKG